MNTRVLNRGIFLLAILVFSLTACQAGGNAVNINPTQGAQMLTGTYTTSISANDVDKLGSLDDLTGSVGTWKILFQPDGKFTAERDGEWIADGDFTVKNSSINIYLKSVCENCSCDQGIGNFTWALADDKLSFVKQAGSCDAMTLVLTSHSLTKVK